MKKIMVTISALLLTSVSMQAQTNNNLIGGRDVTQPNIEIVETTTNTNNHFDPNMIGGKPASELSDAQIKIIPAEIKTTTSTSEMSNTQTSKSVDVYIRNEQAKPIPFPKEDYKRKSNVDQPVNPNFPKDNYQRKTTE